MSLADMLGIKIYYDFLHNKQHPLLEGYADLSRNQIFLDISLRMKKRQEKCVLSEEISHFLYPPIKGCVSYHIANYWETDHSKRGWINFWHNKNERLALKWATSFLVPDSAFWTFARAGPHEWYNWLEHFDVEGWFMEAKFQMAGHREKNLKALGISGFCIL